MLVNEIEGMRINSSTIFLSPPLNWKLGLNKCWTKGAEMFVFAPAHVIFTNKVKKILLTLLSTPSSLHLIQTRVK